MRDPDVCMVEYCGYKQPRSEQELEFEILGLETAIYEAKKRIATLKQSGYLVKVQIQEQNIDNNNIEKN